MRVARDVHKVTVELRVHEKLLRNTGEKEPEVVKSKCMYSKEG